MKKTTILLFLASIILTACSGDKNKRNSDFLAPIEIAIPAEIEGDAELVDLVKSSEKSINEFSDNIEQLIIDGGGILEKSKQEGAEASMMDKLKAGKIMLEFASNSTQIVTTMEKFDTYVQEKQKQGDINDTQLKALEQTGKAFENRMNELNEKYKHLLE